MAESKSIAVTDSISPEKRSANMAAIRGKDTGPELTVRKAIHSDGFRFRLHRRDLPGKPDLVLPRYGVALFVHGCFGHMHKNCPDATVPKTNADFWVSKLDLFLTVTDFHLLVRRNVSNTQQMNQAVFAFRRCEDASLRHTGVDSHQGLAYYGLYDTILARE